MYHKNSFYDYISGNQTVPASTTGTGTITTLGKAVIGVGTKFATEMPAGSWIFNSASSPQEVRRVVTVTSDVLAYLSEAFTADIASIAPKIIKQEDAKCVSIAVSIMAASANGVLDGKVFPAGASVAFSKDSRDSSSQRDLVDPLIVDASGTNMLILIQR